MINAPAKVSKTLAKIYVPAQRSGGIELLVDLVTTLSDGVFVIALHWFAPPWSSTMALVHQSSILITRFGLYLLSAIDS